MLSSKRFIISLRFASIAFVCVALLSGCGGKSYVHQDPDSLDFRVRAETQVDGPISVSAAVLGAEETRSLFGLDLYDQGIQPVWLAIENSGDEQVRYALVGTDPFYFPPLEIAYTNRSGYSDEARSEMERHLHELAIPRYVDAGETREGFVFTHADRGAKGFNVDLFSRDEGYTFTFLLRVPGFVPDYADLDFASIYSEDELTVYEGDALQEAVRGLPCCSTRADDDETGGALNVVLVGEGIELLKALLRSRWIETAAGESVNGDANYLFGREQDAIFRYESFTDDSVYELRLWLAPMLHGEERVWIGEVRHFFGFRGAFGLFDPDVDNARNFMLQKLIYGQALQTLAGVEGEQVMPSESFWANLARNEFFTDGYRVVMWLSGEPFSVLDITAFDWSDPPGLKR
jgi:hypothetical protein